MQLVICSGVCSEEPLHRMSTCATSFVVKSMFMCLRSNSLSVTVCSEEPLHRRNNVLLHSPVAIFGFADNAAVDVYIVGRRTNLPVGIKKIAYRRHRIRLFQHIISLIISRWLKFGRAKWRRKCKHPDYLVLTTGFREGASPRQAVHTVSNSKRTIWLNSRVLAHFGNKFQC